MYKNFNFIQDKNKILKIKFYLNNYSELVCPNTLHYVIEAG